MSRSLRRDRRGVSPVVGKSLAAGLVLAYVAGMTGLLLGGTVPAYETASGDELGDRVLATAAGEIERAVPSTAGDVQVRATVELPATIRDTGYRLVLRGETLTLEHPDDGIGSETRLSLPERLTVEDASWGGDGKLVVRVSGETTERVLTIES